MNPARLLRYDKGWQHKMYVNGFGAVCTAIVMIVFAVTKFREGAWIVLIITPMLVAVFFTIHRHYKDLAAQPDPRKIQRAASASHTPPGDHADQRHPSGNAGSAALCKASFG